MDPNANLARQRELATLIIKLADFNGDPDQRDQIAEAGEELAELAQALDGWLSKGGFRPEAWNK